jgi:hypothetical protein
MNVTSRSLVISRRSSSGILSNRDEDLQLRFPTPDVAAPAAPAPTLSFLIELSSACRRMDSLARALRASSSLLSMHIQKYGGDTWFYAFSEVFEGGRRCP